MVASYVANVEEWVRLPSSAPKFSGGESSNGRTRVFEARHCGSIPHSPAKCINDV